MKTIVIDISQCGQVRCLYTDALPLAEIGQMEVRRASSIEYNNHTGMWEVVMASDPDHVVFTHPSRAACVEWEIETINKGLIQ
jgi:hypothetical protein